MTTRHDGQHPNREESSMTPTDTKTETKTSTTPAKGEAAVRHLWKQAIDDGDEASAKVIATVANLLAPSIKLAAGAEVPAKTADATAQIDGAEVDISDMADADAEDYLQYTREMDGSAARERHVARLEREDEEMREIGRHGG